MADHRAGGAIGNEALTMKQKGNKVAIVESLDGEGLPWA
jgi:hypothetical protein